MPVHAIAVAVLSAVFAVAARADDDVIPHRQDRPPNKPLPAEEAVRRMTVPPGFKVELVAAEPDVINPIAMTFDDRGRIFLTESVEYPRKPAGPGRDRVKILEDTDGDGRAEKVTLFAEGLNIPTGVAVGHGGVWVLNAPDLLFMREKDGKEISREVVVTGFGRADTHELPSSLTWGPDGWLYGLNGVFNPSVVKSNNGREYRFTCAMWRVHPKTREFQVFAEGTSNPYGIAWDEEGSAIIEACHWANDHLFHFVETGYYQRQAGAYPPFTFRIGSITDHSHQKTAYCGIVHLDTDAFPQQYRERICVGNIHGGCVNVDRLERDGATYLAKAEPDLLTANDVWFMPVCLKVGPDGSLYVLDWYDRYHCSQDAARDPGGVDRLKGRLYRLRYGDTPRATKFDLAEATNDELIARLGSGKIYFRESAQRILTERLGSDLTPSLQEPLQRTIFDPAKPRNQRLHALWALIGAGRLDPPAHEKLLDHPDATFRAWGVRAAGNWMAVHPSLRNKLAGLAREPSPDVQLQVAIACRKMKDVDSLVVLADVLAHCGHDKLIPAIAWPNLHPLLETEASRFAALIKGTGPLPPAVATLMPRIIDRILSASTPDTTAVATLLSQTIARNPDRAPECVAAVSAKSGGLNAETLAQLKEQLRPTLQKLLDDPKPTPLRLGAQMLAARLKLAPLESEEVRRKFIAPAESESLRLQALDALIAFRDPSLLETLPGVLTSAKPSLATKILTSLGRVEDPKLADAILPLYARLSPELQPLAIDLLMQREPWARKLLNAVLAGTMPKSVLNANHLRKILDSNDREAVWAVEKAFGQVRHERNPDREKVVAEMTAFLRENPGDPVAGQRVFKNLCAQCHTMYGEGQNVGPDLTGNGRASFEQLVSNVFDPSLVIGPAYQVTTVVTRDGRNLTGLIVEDNAQRIVMRLPGEGEEAVPKNQVKYTRTSKLSMMPEGIESLLQKKDLIDLFAYLSMDKPPDDPTAQPIPGAPPRKVTPAPAPAPEARIKLDRKENRLGVRARLPQSQEWIDLATFVMEPRLRPYLHPLRDPAGRIVLTEDKPADHPWQHGVFTGFHRVNSFNYWKEDQGRQRFVRLLDEKESPDRVSWRALVELVAPDGAVVLEEEDAITIYAPESPDAYVIDFDLLLRAKDREVKFGKFFVGGLAVRMPWDKEKPRHTHLNSEGVRGRDCEQKRAAWCTVQRPFDGQTFGFAVFDHTQNANHPPAWRADEQGLINPNVSGLADWSIPAGKERLFKYRLLVYRGSPTAEQLAARFEAFVRPRRQ